MIQIQEDVWNKIAGSVVAWRKAFDRGGTDDVSPVTALLLEASELILHPPKPSTVRDLEDGAQTYRAGPHHSRILMEYRARRIKDVVTFLEYDLNEGNPKPVHVDPNSVKEEPQGVIQYKLIATEPPRAPRTVGEANEFFRQFAKIHPDAMFIPSLIRSAVVYASSKGLLPQANQAALLLARHYGWETNEVNPFPSHSDAPWTDVIGDAPMPAHSTD